MTFSLKKTHLLVLAASVLALSAAYIAEFGFDLKPCHLCLLQRYPYMVAIGFSALGLWCLPRLFIARGTLVLSLLSLAIGSGIAWYHSGVEREIFEGPSGCTTGGGGGSIDDLRASILSNPIVACNQPAFEWMGITMTNMNAAYSTLLVLFLLYAFHQARSGDRASHQPAKRRSMAFSEENAGSIKK